MTLTRHGRGRVLLYDGPRALLAACQAQLKRPVPSPAVLIEAARIAVNFSSAHDITSERFAALLTQQQREVLVELARFLSENRATAPLGVQLLRSILDATYDGTEGASNAHYWAHVTQAANDTIVASLVQLVLSKARLPLSPLERATWLYVSLFMCLCVL